MQEFLINHWEALSSLLLSVVAITIAIISARSTARQSEKNVEKNVQGINKVLDEYIKQSINHLNTMKYLACAAIDNAIINIELNINKLEFEKQQIKAYPYRVVKGKEKANESSNNDMESFEIDENAMNEYNMYKIDNIKEHISNLRVLREELLDILVSIDEDEKYRSKRRGFRDHYWYYYR